MENSNPEAEISFRFNNLDKLQAFTLVREILGSSYEEDLSNNCFVGYVPLTQKNFDDINDYYVRQRIEIAECDIFISITPTTDENIIAIPAIVNKMLKYIDCKLTISFTSM